MHFKTDEELRKYLTKKVRYDIAKEKWGFNGVKFRLSARYFVGDFCTFVEYTCDLNEINVGITRWCNFTKNYEEVAEKTFNGKDSISNCLDWVVDKLMEIYKLLNERTAPYALNRNLYEQALSRPLNM